MTKKTEVYNDFTHVLNILQDRSDNRDIEPSDSHKKNELLEEELLVDRNKVSRELFFICKNCSGPLIQYTFCRICKKTAYRICAKCGLIKTVGDHNQCFRLVFLDLE